MASIGTDTPKRRAGDQGWRVIVRENWYRDVWLLLITILALGSIVIGNHQNRERISDNKKAIAQIQVERKRNALVICEQLNRQNAAILAFIRRSIPARRLRDPQVIAYLQRAARSFPQVDCSMVVQRTIDKP